jgi:thiamine-monophosphate kinase
VTVREGFITIAEYGEFALIAAIEKVLPDNAGLIVGIGDDAAVVRAPDGRVVATADMLIEGRHFRREWSAPRDIGGKAAARNLADIAAMGARPTALLVSFAGPGDLEVSWVLELVAGIAEEAAAAGATVAGGDTSGADVVMLAVTALGDLAGGQPVTRSGARPGDVVAVTGTLGSAAAGLALLRAGAETGSEPAAAAAAAADTVGSAGGVAGSAGRVAGAVAGTESSDDVRLESGDSELKSLISAHRRPRPPYSAGPEAAALGATAMIDISDGLIADLGHVASASGVQLELAGRAIAAEPVTRRRLLARAADLLGDGTDWQRWVLTGGDDHALAATFPPGLALPERWTEIGLASEGRGILLDGRTWNDAGGWEHFLA